MSSQRSWIQKGFAKQWAKYQDPGKEFLQRMSSYILDGRKIGLLNICNFVSPNKCNFFFFLNLSFNKAVLMASSDILVSDVVEVQPRNMSFQIFVFWLL